VRDAPAAGNGSIDDITLWKTGEQGVLPVGGAIAQDAFSVDGTWDVEFSSRLE